MKLRRTHALVGGIGALAVLLTACGTAGSPNDPPRAPTVTATETATQTETTTATATATETVHPDRPPATTNHPDRPPATTNHPVPPPPPPTTKASSLPPVTPEPDPDRPSDMSDAEIRVETVEAFGVVDTYWQNLIATWVDPQGRLVQSRTPDLFNGDGFYDSARGFMAPCGDQPPVAYNAFFCGNTYTGTGSMAFDMELMRDEMAFGDGAIYATVAHEMGHAAQTRFMHDDESGASPPEWDTHNTELQADCLAGATMSKAEQDEYLIIEPGDLDEISASIIVLNDSAGDHGTDEQRIAAFYLGYNSGNIESCLYNQGVPPPGWVLA